MYVNQESRTRLRLTFNKEFFATFYTIFYAFFEVKVYFKLSSSVPEDEELKVSISSLFSNSSISGILVDVLVEMLDFFVVEVARVVVDTVILQHSLNDGSHGTPSLIFFKVQLFPLAAVRIPEKCFMSKNVEILSHRAQLTRVFEKLTFTHRVCSLRSNLV